MSKTGKRIPIKGAKEIGNKYGYSQVIVVAFDKETGISAKVEKVTGAQDL